MVSILSALAFMMAFGAIWFTSEILKRVQHQNDIFLNAHVKNMKHTVTRSANAIRDMEKRLVALEKRVDGFNRGVEALATIGHDISSPRVSVADMERFIPSSQSDTESEVA